MWVYGVHRSIGLATASTRLASRDVPGLLLIQARAVDGRQAPSGGSVTAVNRRWDSLARAKIDKCFPDFAGRLRLLELRGGRCLSEPRLHFLPVLAWTNTRITGIRARLTHWHRAAMQRTTSIIRRTPLVHRSAVPRRSVPIRLVSERKVALSNAANTARGLVRDRDGCCIRCGNPGVDAHHRLPRGGGGALWDPSRFALSRLVWLCRDDHRWVESTGCWRGLGLLVRHGVTPCSEVPVFHRGRWVLLDDNGGVVQVEADVGGFEVAS